MRVDMPGLHKTTKTLADGTRKAYYYAWRGGPRLKAEPRTPEFVQEFIDHWKARRSVAEGTIAWLIEEFKSSDAWSGLKPRTQADHEKMFVLIKERFGDTTLRRAEAKGSRKHFKTWRDVIGRDSPKTADKAAMSLSRLFTFAIDEEHMSRNPISGIGKLYTGNRADKWWRDDEIARFRATASPQLRFALLMALHTGQRQGDLLGLQWSGYDGSRINLVQSKTGSAVSILCSPALKATLDEKAESKTSTHILLNSRGIPWTSLGFQASWRKATRRAGIADRTFHDLRGTFVIQALRAGQKLEDIARVTGHSTKDLRTLETYYMGWDQEAADAVILSMHENK